MASSSSRQPSLVFGIEIEFLLRPRSAIYQSLSALGWNPNVTPNDQNEALKERNRVALRAAIARALTLNNILASTQPNKYSDWTVVDERTLDEVTVDKSNGFWRVEMVSRTMTTAENWQSEIAQVFNVLTQSCEIAVSQGCSMHIHVSPSMGQVRYSTEQLRCILKAISYFDDPITQIMPAGRKANKWAMSSLQGDDAPSNLKSAYQAVPRATWAPLFRIFDIIKMSQAIPPVVGKDRYWSWDFQHIAAACGTVEFRRPPGVKTAREAIHWTGFTLGLIRQAMLTNWTSNYQKLTTYPNVRELERFVRQGIAQLEPTCRDAVGAIEADNARPTIFSVAELEAIKRKKASKGNKDSPYVEKANSRPNSPVPSNSSRSSSRSSGRR